MSVLQKLTEGIVDRSLKQEGAALLEKWERTGLLEGLSNDNKKNTMARLLENQAAQLLKEATSMSAGDVEGFASVAFPIVRRVFGGLIANDLVSVQPMSLPSGLIFFMDFTRSTEDRAGGEAGDADTSIYGGGKVAKGIVDGVSLTGAEADKSFYNLNNGYTSPTGSTSLTWTVASDFGGATLVSALSEAQKKMLRYDPDLLSQTATQVQVYTTPLSAFEGLNTNNLITISGSGLPVTDRVVRRLTSITGSGTDVTLVVEATAGTVATGTGALVTSYAQTDAFAAGGAIGAVKGTDPWGLEGASNAVGAFDSLQKDVIPEIDIKVDSIAVTAITKKLKAKWTPELGQDLNAYHNLDAEVELTQILSEQIALEIDREIVNDLVQGATAGTMYWSRSPGLFVHKTLGTELGASSAAPDFTGTVSEWYETLVETINDVSAQIHRKTLRGGANFLVVSPEVANILEFTSGFRASLTADSDKGTVGAVKSGSLSKKWDVFVDPYFPRNVVLVGRRGGSFLESGYVYAPYVPLQVTPTIFGTEDFVPRKGVMTRYAKKMVRPDMYGIVIVRGLLGEEGSS